MRQMLAIAAGLMLLGAACAGDGGDEPAVPQGRFLSTSRSLTPGTLFFGDAFTARVELVVDRDRLDPDRIRLAAEFPPYERVGGLRVERRDYDRYTRLRYDLTVRCLELPCLAGEVSPGGPGSVLPGQQPPSRRGERVFRFRPAHLYYDEPGKKKPRHLKRVWWPRLEVLTRISPTDPSLTFSLNTPFRTTITPLPGLSYRVSATLLGALLLLGAALLLALPAWMTVSWLRRRRPPPVIEEERELTPLERALLLVDQTRDSVDGVDRRQALEVLALELGATGEVALADQARHLAWSPSIPSPDAAGALSESVRRSNAA